MKKTKKFNKNKYAFIRYGSLNPKRQRGYSTDTSKDLYHVPPARKGYYSFPFGYEELFLVIDLPYQGQFLPTITKYEKFIDEWTTYECKDIWKVKRYFNKDRDDLIWHHLGEFTDIKDILDNHGHWVKTTVEVWKKSFNRCLSSQRMETFKTDFYGYKYLYEVPYSGNYNYDNLEVFFEK